jgi:hypothetical protein
MKTISILVSAFLVVSFSVLTGLSAGQAAPATTQTKAPASSLNELENDFQMAKQDFVKKDYAKAASEIRQAEAYVDTQAEQAGGAAKRDLVNVGNELDGLAEKLQKGTVKSEKDISTSASQTYHALARYNVGKASESFSQKAESLAGEYLKTAADAIEKAWVWSGREIHSGTRTTIQEAREAADEVKMGSNEASANVSQAIHSLRSEISKFRNKSSNDPKSRQPGQQRG